ncbi:hypothetical protein [Roseateles oligotrophus]|nr:hypothetical protein [Roseateles oligotrophus]
MPAHPVQTGNAEAGGRGSGLPPAGKLDDRAAPDTVPLKAVP